MCNNDIDLKIEDLRSEIKNRIKKHRLPNRFQPNVTYNKTVDDYTGEIIVNYYVDFSSQGRSEYKRKYFPSDRFWVERRGADDNITASLFCKWTT